MRLYVLIPCRPMGLSKTCFREPFVMGAREKIISDCTIRTVFLTQPTQLSALVREKGKYLFDKTETKDGQEDGEQCPDLPVQGFIDLWHSVPRNHVPC